MLESYQDDIISSLVKMGYTVELASKVKVNYEDHVSAVIALTISKSDDLEIVISKIYEELVSALTENEIYFYSIIIAESVNATWSGGNIVFPPKKSPPQLPPPRNDKNSKLN